MTESDRSAVTATVVTISATYGAGGSVIGPAVAGQLGLPFVDRAIPAAVAQSLAIPLEEALTRDDRSESGIRRVIASFAQPAALTGAMAVPLGPVGESHDYKSHCEAAIHSLAERGGVVLGRAGAVVLSDRPGALHVRLDGPVDARVARSMHAEGIDEETARCRQKENDAGRSAYVNNLYRVKPEDPSLYHLILDSTAIGDDACVEIITVAARARSANGPAGSHSRAAL